MMKRSIVLLMMLVSLNVVSAQDENCAPEGKILIPNGQHFFILQGVKNDHGVIESNHVEFCATTGTLTELDSFMIIEGIRFSYGWWLVDVYDLNTLESLGRGWFQQRGIALIEISITDSSFFEQYLDGDSSLEP